jgi:hypothetical protein
MKPPIFRIVILSLALSTHGKLCHGCIVPVIGDICHYGVTGSAVRAINKRVSVTAVQRIKKLSETIVTDGNIGGD